MVYTINGTTSNQYIECKVQWYNSTDANTNSSKIRVELFYRRTNEGYTTSGTGTFRIFIDGTIVASADKYVNIGTEWTRVCYGDYTVSHNSDGTKSVTIIAGGQIPGTTLTSTTLSANVDLDAVQLTPVLNSFSCSTEYLDGKFTVKFKVRSTAHYHQIEVYYQGNRTKNVNLSTYSTTGEKTKQFDFLQSELYTIYESMPNGGDSEVRVALLSYKDSAYNQLVGSSNISEPIKLKIPNDATTQPTVSMTLAPTSSSTLPSPYNTLYLQGLSKVKATLTSEAKHKATIVASLITVEGENYEAPYESHILTKDGTISVKATVKDSREFYGTYYKDIEVIPYSKPYVRAKSYENEIVVARCDQSGNLSDSGTYLKIKAKVVYSKVITNNVQNNYGKIKMRWRIEGGSYTGWQTIHDSETDSNHSDEVITEPLLNGALDIKKNYQVQVIASDDLFDSAPITFSVPSDEVYMHRPAGGKSMGLGGYAQSDGNLDVYWRAMARGGVSVFDAGGGEIPLDKTLPITRDQVKEGWNPDNLDNGVYAVTSAKALKQGDTVIMYNGVLIQMTAYVDGNVKIQLALTSDETRNPFYRVYWYGNWGNWRSLKL